ncbi:stage V sporulation protein AB [Lederbergia wuyishanensis]|uniref:Stage V sporulation protein AB n=1 Tax=Lederbergia wuyishanensis TaxID=1347903 RepID=A0ABU0D134_9BACI|nr:stage V sporulation protein AB [Lederbergia wuyishanensis]MCJ8006727.1 stage V sporulation protein AB [Lederbergia wuyishanensis]MDQ0342109.1 stage V sporulation protein AB [Lederbergia wuyishanensis]
MLIETIVVILIGLAGGLAVGSGFVAFLTVLGIIPRLTQLSKTDKMIQSYEWAVILGAVCSGWVDLRDQSLHINFSLLMIIIGLFCGLFIGMLAAALTEVLNVIPILSKRIGLEKQLITLLMAIVLGKIFGSLFQWLYFNII